MLNEQFSTGNKADLDQGESSLGRRAVVGGMWVFALKAANRTLGLVRTIILARLLSPNDFGLMGLAVLAIETMEAFSKTGIESALIQKKHNINEYLDTAWTIQVLRSVFLFALLFFGAPFVARFFETPSAMNVIRVLAFMELFRGAKNIGVVYFPKELRFDKDFILDLSGLIVNMSVSITMAFIVRNVWALVYGSLSGVFVIFVMSYILQPYRPGIRFKMAEASELLDFGKWLLGSSILGFIITQGDDAFVGKFLGITALGFYQMAYRLSNAPATEITHVISRVTFPVYSKIQDNVPRLKEAYLKVLQVTAFFSFLLTGLIFVFAQDFTRIFLGQKWMPMVPAMRILTLWGAVRSIGATTGPFFYAGGRPNILAKLQFWQLALLVATIYPLTARWGISGTSLSVLFAALAPNIAAYHIVIRAVNCRYYDFWKMILFPTAAAVAVYAGIFSLKKWMGPEPNMYQFILLAFSAIAVYALVILVFERLFGYGIRKVVKEYLMFKRQAGS